MGDEVEIVVDTGAVGSSKYNEGGRSCGGWERLLKRETGPCGEQEVGLGP